MSFCSWSQGEKYKSHSEDGRRETTMRSIGVPLGKFYISMVSKTLFSAFSSGFFFIVTDPVFSLCSVYGLRAILT